MQRHYVMVSATKIYYTQQSREKLPISSSSYMYFLLFNFHSLIFKKIIAIFLRGFVNSWKMGKTLRCQNLNHIQKTFFYPVFSHTPPYMWKVVEINKAAKNVYILYMYGFMIRCFVELIFFLFPHHIFH